jgi:hypothetical protein
MALEDGTGVGGSFCMGNSSLAGFSGTVLSSQLGSSPTDAIMKGLDLSRGLYTGDQMAVHRAGRIILTKRCLISTPSKMDPKKVLWC